MPSKRLSGIMGTAIQTDDASGDDDGIDVIDKNDPHVDATEVFFYACQSGNSDLVQKMVLAKLVDLGAKNEHGDTALYRAARVGNADIVRFLCEMRADRPENSYGRAAIHQAVVQGHANVLEVLIASKNQQEACSMPLMYTNDPTSAPQSAQPTPPPSPLPADEASRKARSRSVTGDTGRSRRNTDTYVMYMCCLMYSSKKHKDDVINVSKRMSVMRLSEHLSLDEYMNLPDEYGMTPVHLAAAFGQSDCLDMLLKNGADKDALDRQGRTALDVSIDIQCRALLNDSALHTAAAWGDVKAIQYVM